MKNYVLIAILSICFSLCQGCATPGGFGRFYQAETSVRYPPTQNVRVYTFSQDGLWALQNDGYEVIGQAHFNGPLAPPSQAIAQAKKVGAEVVLVDVRHTDTRQATLPITQYHAPQTTTIRSFSSASGSAYGSGGYAYGNATGYGTSYVRTPGYTTTQFIPMTIMRYDHSAIFLRKTHDAAVSPAPIQIPMPAKDDVLSSSPEDLLYKGVLNLTGSEQEEMLLLLHSSPRYLELQKKAINTLTLDEQRIINEHQKELNIIL